MPWSMFPVSLERQKFTTRNLLPLGAAQAQATSLNHGLVTVVSVAWCLAGPGNARWNSARVCQRFDSPRLRYIESGRRFGLRGSSCHSDRVWIWPSKPSASAQASRLQMLDFYISSFETDSPRLRPTAKASHGLRVCHWHRHA